MVGQSADPVAQVAFEHADDRFDLAAAAVDLAIETLFHQATVAALGQLAGGAGPALFGRDDRANTVLVAQEPMIGFRIAAGVGHQLFDDRAGRGMLQQFGETIDVGLRATARSGPEDGMVQRVRENAQLRIVPLRHRFLRFSALFGPPDIVAAGVDGFQAGGVGGGGFDAFAPPQDAPHAGGQHSNLRAPKW